MHSCTREMAGFRCDMKEADFPCMASAVDESLFWRHDIVWVIEIDKKTLIPMPRVIAQLSVHVLTPSPGRSQGYYVSKCIELIQKHPVKYEIHALATTIEGKHICQ